VLEIDRESRVEIGNPELGQGGAARERFIERRASGEANFFGARLFVAQKSSRPWPPRKGSQSSSTGLTMPPRSVGVCQGAAVSDRFDM